MSPVWRNEASVPCTAELRWRETGPVWVWKRCTDTVQSESVITQHGSCKMLGSGCRASGRNDRLSFIQNHLTLAASMSPYWKGPSGIYVEENESFKKKNLIQLWKKNLGHKSPQQIVTDFTEELVSLSVLSGYLIHSTGHRPITPCRRLQTDSAPRSLGGVGWKEDIYSRVLERKRSFLTNAQLPRPGPALLLSQLPPVTTLKFTVWIKSRIRPSTCTVNSTHLRISKPFINIS